MLQVEQIPLSAMMRIQETAKTNPAGTGFVSFEEVRKAAARETSEGNDIQWFKDQLLQKLAGIPSDRSVAGCAVDISTAGLRAMLDDPAYAQQVLSLISREFRSSYAPRNVKVHIRVGKNLDEYQVHTYSSGDDAEYNKLSATSFYTREGTVTNLHSPMEERPTPSAFRIFRDHLQMQLEKMDNPPAQRAPRAKGETMSIYDAMGYETPGIRAFEA